ncbi:MAG: SDR family oxidoreductase [Planctomycetota bacterium]|nr:SDR family oxidoreductase [Planctomycetota bacterium]
MFSVKGRVAAITGAGGILCGEMARALASLGAKVAVMDLREDAAKAVADGIRKEGGEAVAVATNVLERKSLEDALKKTEDAFGGVDILINGAGGNHKMATASDALEFFDIPPDAVQFVFNLNCLGTILPSQVFGRALAARKSGLILNIASMAAYRPLTKVLAYSAAKAAVVNFTQWLAVHMARNYSVNIRVNAIAPGFFLTEQNRFLLTDEQTGQLTARGKAIIEHTPMARFGEPSDLIGAVVWLCSPSASFVTGAVIAVDGGFSAYSGV